MRRWLIFILALPTLSFGYPMDGYETTGMARLEVQRRIQAGELEGRKVPTGGLLPMEQVDIRLRSYPDFVVPPSDPEFSAELIALLGDRAPDYQFAVLDISDPTKPRLGTHQEHTKNNVGSIGKLIVALGLFEALATIYPDDVNKRRALLAKGGIVADELVLGDHHDVKLWNRQTDEIFIRPLAPGDTGSLWDFADWAISASSNAAASTLIKNTMLLHHFGQDYPVAPTIEQTFLSTTEPDILGQLLRRSLDQPLVDSGFDLETIRQGSFFTRSGVRRVPAARSYATPMTLLRYLVKMEQGALVDDFSSREIKRLMYTTEKRIRYASSPALYRSAVYFKSGSFYQCAAEPGFRCIKYRGNVKNQMNSVAVVESIPGDKPVHYIAVLTSNVLRRNSAVDHQTLATGIHELITTGAVTRATALARTEEELARDQKVDIGEQN